MARIIADHEPESAEIAGICLQEKSVLLYPTDTIYGLGCDALNGDGVMAIKNIKGRRENKPFILLAGSMARIARNFVIEKFYHQLDDIWPGPFTVLLEPKHPKLKTLAGSNGKIGIRMAEDSFLSRLFLKWDGLLISTSANKSGVPYTHQWSVIFKTFQTEIDTMIQRENYPLSKPSSIIEFTKQGWIVYREGPISLPDSFNICK